MTLTRIARHGWLAGLCLLTTGFALTAGGCKRPKDKPVASGVKTAEPATLAVPGAATQTPVAAAEPRGADSFARQFLKAVNDGTATPGQLTPQFKKVIAEPVFESDRAAGYSEAGAASWLAQFKGKLTGANVASAVPGDAPAFVGGTGAKGVYALRVAPAGGGWLADWFVVAPDTGTGPVAAGSTAFAAAAFLEAVIAKDDVLAAGLMTPAAKAKLAPPFDSDKARGFNRGILSSRLGDLRGSATGFTVESAGGPTATASLTSGGPKRPVALKFVKGERPWDWLVDDIEAK